MPAASDPVILLPPSEGKTAGGTGAAWQVERRSHPELDAYRREIIAALRRTAGSRAAAERAFGVGGRHLEVALADLAALDDAPTRPAAERYSGVVWAAVGVAGLDPQARERLDARVLVPSGMWGLVAATDGIPPYRLKMAARLDGVGLVSRWWADRLAETLRRRLEGRVVFDLLPGEHGASWRPTEHDILHVPIVVVEEREDGSRVAVGHAAKDIKGRVARMLIERDIRSPAELAGQELAGHRFSVTRSGVTLSRFRQQA